MRQQSAVTPGTLEPQASPLGEISYNVILRLPFSQITGAALSYFHEGIHMKPGIDLVTRRRGYSKYCLYPPQEHLRLLRDEKLIGMGPVVVQTYRNSPQNPRSPLVDRRFGVCHNLEDRVAESERPYRGIAFVDDGFEALALDLRDPVPDRVRFFATGIPVLWADRVSSLEELAPEVGDACHLWKLNTRLPADRASYEAIHRVFKEYRHAPAGPAGAAIVATARDLGLVRDTAYLHNVVALSRDSMFLALVTGSLEKVGETLRAAGATHGVVVDNGGSPFLGLAAKGGPLRPTAQSFYFREPSLVVAAYELHEPDPDRPSLVSRGV